MGFAYIAGASGVNTAADTTLATSATLNVAAGDVLVCWAAHESGAASGLAVSDGGSNSFTMEAETTTSDEYGAFGVVLVASANATATFTASFGASVAYRNLIVMQFRPDAGETVAADQKNTGTGDSDAALSGAITTTGTDEVVLGAVKCDGNTTSTDEAIGGTAADGVERSGQLASMWYRILTGTAASIAATRTLTSSPWVCNIFSVKSTATGSTYATTVILRQYAQQIGA